MKAKRGEDEWPPYMEHLSIMYITMGVFVESEISTMSMAPSRHLSLRQIVTEV
jgi:hypothetical protein